MPVHVVEFDDQQVFEAALVENIQRSDLNPIEKAQGFKDYLDRFGMTQEQLGAKLGLDRTTISNLLGLLNLPAEVQDAVRLGQITLGHAKVLKGVADAERQVALCKETILKNYSVHALELLVKQQQAEAAAAGEPAAKREPVEKTAHVQGLEDELRQRLAVRVEIKVKAKDKGQIVIGFDSNDDFERIVDGMLTRSSDHEGAGSERSRLSGAVTGACVADQPAHAAFRRSSRPPLSPSDGPAPVDVPAQVDPPCGHGRSPCVGCSRSGLAVAMRPSSRQAAGVQALRVDGRAVQGALPRRGEDRDESRSRPPKSRSDPHIRFGRTPRRRRRSWSRTSTRPTKSAKQPAGPRHRQGPRREQGDRTARSIEDKEMTVGAEKYPGRDVLIEKPLTRVRNRIVIAGPRLYQVMVQGPKEFVTGRDADRFLDAFEVTK